MCPHIPAHIVTTTIFEQHSNFLRDSRYTTQCIKQIDCIWPCVYSDNGQMTLTPSKNICHPFLRLIRVHTQDQMELFLITGENMCIASNQVSRSWLQYQVGVIRANKLTSLKLLSRYATKKQPSAYGKIILSEPIHIVTQAQETRNQTRYNIMCTSKNASCISTIKEPSANQ